MTCVKCPNGKSNWWRFLLSAFLPLTIFCFIILLFQINVTSSHLHGFVYCSQTIATPVIARVIFAYAHKFNSKAVTTAIRCIGTFYGMWNLDILRYIDLGICLPIDALQILVLDLAVGIYPLLLMALTYILKKIYDRNFRPIVFIWRPFGAIIRLLNKNWNIRTSLIDAFGAFLFLSTLKFMNICFDLLVPIKVHQLQPTGHVTVSWRLYYDATVPYFGERHLPYAILGIVACLVFIVLPAMLFLLYPFVWFQKCLNLFPARWYILHTFMDIFQGCYKDGTPQGTRDYRWFAFIFFISRVLAYGDWLSHSKCDVLPHCINAYHHSCDFFNNFSAFQGPLHLHGHKCSFLTPSLLMVHQLVGYD